MATATFVTSSVNPDDLTRYTKPHVALVGRSNVGKSSLINHLTGQRALARVSAAPGHTRTINLYDIHGRYFLVDLPGYGYARTSHDARAGFATMITRYLTETPQLALVCVVIDAVVGPTSDDHDMLELVQSTGIPFVVIVNKIDKLAPRDVDALMRTLTATFPHATFLPHSIKTATHRGVITDTIDRAVRHHART